MKVQGKISNDEALQKKWQAKYEQQYKASYEAWKEKHSKWEALEKLKSHCKAIEHERKVLESEVKTLAQLLLKDPLQLAFQDLTFYVGETDKNAERAGREKQNELRPFYEKLQRRLSGLFGDEKNMPSLSVLLFDDEKQKLLHHYRAVLEQTGEKVDIEARLTGVFIPYRQYVKKYYEWAALRKFIAQVKNGTYKPSNREVLDIADEWIYPLLLDITRLDTPNHSDVEKIFEKHFPTLKMLESTPWLFAQGEIKKEPVASAIKFIFDIKHPEKDISTGAIIKRYERKGLW